MEQNAAHSFLLVYIIFIHTTIQEPYGRHQFKLWTWTHSIQLRKILNSSMILAVYSIATHID